MRDDAAADGGTPPLAELLHRADPAELIAEVDRACARRDWDHLLLVRARCAAAAEELGKQLWPVAQYAAYRCALEAPAPLACRVVEPGAARFALGPLTEVVAAHHAWDDLAPHLDLPFVAATVAQERVVRGEDLRGDARAHAAELDLPLVLADWEPRHPLPTYRSTELVEDAPRDPAGGWRSLDTTQVASPAEWPHAERAAADLLTHWTASSSGTVHVAAFAGVTEPAVAATVAGAVEVARLDLDEAVERLVWAGATGAARGRRRGLAAGRSSTWWLLHALTGADWPADVDVLGAALGRLHWWAFREAGAQPGWACRVAIERPDRERPVTLVLDATDRR